MMNINNRFNQSGRHFLSAKMAKNIEKLDESKTPNDNNFNLLHYFDRSNIIKMLPPIHSFINETELYNLNNRYGEKELIINKLLSAFKADNLLLGLSDEQYSNIETALKLCDIGNVMVPNGILNKNGPLSFEDWAEIDKHPSYSVIMLKNCKDNNIICDNNINESVLSLIEKHNAKYFKPGEPKATIEQQLVIAIDNYSAMVQKRPFRDPMKSEKVISILEETYYKDSNGQNTLEKFFDEKIINILKKVSQN